MANLIILCLIPFYVFASRYYTYYPQTKTITPFPNFYRNSPYTTTYSYSNHQSLTFKAL